MEATHTALIGAGCLREQMDLFGETAGVSAAPPARRLTHVERIFEIGFSEKVRAELLQIASTHHGEWLRGRDFWSVIAKHGISSCFGHVLSHLARAGMLLEQKCYFGSQHPSDGNYMGYESRYAALGTEGPSVRTGVRDGR